MDCQEYLTRFSDVLDGQAEAETCEAMDAHRRSCAACERYSHTLEVGRDLLKSTPGLDVPADFRRRLHHRILHVQDGPALRGASLASGATVSSMVLVAALIASAAWAPALDRHGTSVELPAVVVVAPPGPSFTPDETAPTFPRSLPFLSRTEFQDGIWGDSHDLLREYSPILERRREQAFIRAGIE